MLAPDAKLIHYVLEYNTMNMNGTEDIGGTENQLIIIQGEEIRLEGLIAGSVYNVRVKVKYNAWFPKSWLHTNAGLNDARRK